MIFDTPETYVIWQDTIMQSKIEAMLDITSWFSCVGITFTGTSCYFLNCGIDQLVMLYECVVWSPLCVRSWICFPLCLASNAVCTSKLVFQNGLLLRRFLLVFLWPLPHPLGWPSLADWIGVCFFRCESLVIACLCLHRFVLVLP